MYLEHYGLKEPPFSITPDPRFVFLSERHRDALAHLLFGIGQGGGGGFVQLTGEVGTGKTTLCRLLLEQLPENTRVALVLNPRLNAVELLETICEELHLDIVGRRGSIKSLVDALNAYLLGAYAQGLRVVLIIDEAQNLSVEALEQVRLLTNLETDTQKLLQIILLGQPELRELLARPDMRQLAQRITARYHLMPLDGAETAAYLRHRHRVAGGLHLPFTPGAIRRIHRHAGGVPRLINVIAERALLGGYAHDATLLDERDVDRAAREALAPAKAASPRWRWVAAAASVAIIVGAALLWPRMQQAPAVANAATPAKAVAPVAPPRKPAVAVPRIDGDALLARVVEAGAESPQAWQRLLAAWHSDATPAVAMGCPPAVAPGLYCVRGWATLDKLMTQGRPAMLRLRNGTHETWALLLGADALRVRLQLGGKILDVDRFALQRAWDGDYAALWRGPESLATPTTPDGRGPAVDWVHAHLQPEYEGPAVLDGAMVDAVRTFQRAHGLATDGVVGPETLMALAANEPGPTLRTRLD
ncbi:MAG TPA: AAA family ATPase [Lysobacter sp.]|nr:AAA family ATPase [Lysobacter sp.]